MNYFNYANVLIENGIYYSGISYAPTYNKIVGSSTILSTTVQINEIYRPDKIAQRIWGIDDSWVLDIINGFRNGIKEYEFGTTINYVSLAQLKNAGIF